MKRKPHASGAAHTIAFQGGSYSLLLSAVVLALLVVVNILFSLLPSNLTKYDISAAKLYSDNVVGTVYPEKIIHE